MKKLVVLATLLSLLFLFSGCNGEEKPEATQLPTSASTEPAIDAVQIYQDAVKTLSELPCVNVQIGVEKQVFVDTQVFHESWEYALTYKDLDQDTFTAKMVADVNFGDVHSASVEELYYEGCVYGKVNNYSYKVESAQDDYFDRHAPAVLLDPSVYASVTLEDNVISFADAIHLEDWLYRDGFVMEKACGTATLDAQMQLTGFTYSVAYLYGNIRYETDYITEITDSGAVLEKPSIYTPWNEIPLADAPIMMERAYGYLLESDTKSVSTLQLVESDAVGFSVVEQNDLLIHREQDLKMVDHYNVQILEVSTGGFVEYELGNIYKDGVLTYYEDDVEPTTENVTEAEMEAYCEGLLDYHYPVMMNLRDFVVSEVQGGMVFDYTMSSSISEGLRETAQAFLFGEPQYLDLQASGYELLMAEGYLAIDRYSGLPTSNSITYSALHTIDGEKYPLAMQITKTIHASDRSVYTAITGENLPEQETPEQPTRFSTVSADKTARKCGCWERSIWAMPEPATCRRRFMMRFPDPMHWLWSLI